jgi:hypothetical protein
MAIQLNDHNRDLAGIHHDVHHNADLAPDLINVPVGYVILLIEFIAKL